MSGKRAFITASVFSLLSVSWGLLATEWHVAPAPLGNDSNPGTDELPFGSIQRGIGAASAGDTVIVAEGTYVENIQFNGTNIVLRSTDPLNPDVVASTIIDGNQVGSVVTFFGTEAEACTLSGFTIRNGNAKEYGGGIRGNGTLATIENDTITGNSAEDSGGGLWGCHGRIQNSTIADNVARVRGGGGLSSCAGTIQNNTITGNSAFNGGGLFECSATIQDSTIVGNSANYGAGLAGCGGTVQNNTIIGNSAQQKGGGLFECSGPIQNNRIVGNSARNSAEKWLLGFRR